MTGRALARIQSAPMEPCQPWPRYVLTWEDWAELAGLLADDALILLAVWADTGHVHALLDDPVSGTIVPISVGVQGGSYPALSAYWPVAIWFERMIHDLWGHAALGGAELVPWLDHGHWPVTQPMASRPGPPIRAPEPPVFQEIPGDGLIQWPIGPVGPGVGEAAHLRLTLQGETIVHAQARFGYTHKGTLAMMRGKPIRTAARFAARLAGDSTVAHSTAFAMAAEAALGVTVPPRAAALRELMGGLERIATHLDILGSVAELLGAAAVHGLCGLRQEHLRRAMAAGFGHRLLMDCVVPGGVAGDLEAAAVVTVRSALEALRAVLPGLRAMHIGNALAARLNGLGSVDAARRTDPSINTATCGDAATRAMARLDAITADITALMPLLDALPEGALAVSLPSVSGEGLARSVSARGDVWHWLRLDHGQVAAVFPRDPGWALWPAAEMALCGAAADDAAVICCSLGLAASVVDL